MNRCRKIWEYKFPSEPFENEADDDSRNYSSVFSEDLLDQVSKCRNLCRMYSEPYYCEMVYLVAAKQRYRGFVYMVHRFGDECSCIVPTSDVLLMWLTHQVSFSNLFCKILMLLNLLMLLPFSISYIVCVGKSKVGMEPCLEHRMLCVTFGQDCVIVVVDLH